MTFFSFPFCYHIVVFLFSTDMLLTNNVVAALLATIALGNRAGGKQIQSIVTRQLLGTCGDGNVGNALCPDTTLCCSIYGWCGNTADYCGNEASVAPSLTPPPSPYPPNCASVSDVMTVNFGYYASWASGRSKTCNQVAPQSIDVAGNNYTHLAYAFAGINGSYQIAPSYDDYAGEVPQYFAFNALKKTYPSLKTLISVGGGDFNATLFSIISASPTRRATFAASVVAFLQTVSVLACLLRVVVWVTSKISQLSLLLSAVWI